MTRVAGPCGGIKKKNDRVRLGQIYHGRSCYSEALECETFENVVMGKKLILLGRLDIQ